MSKLITRCLGALFAAVLWAVGAGPAFATDPDNVNSRLEGCRITGSITLPNGSGQFICPDGAYTTGNLGKFWNELDLVPYRITMGAGTSAPNTQTYTVAVVVDNLDATRPGYDVLSVPTLNTLLSAPSCTAASVGPETFALGFGGIDRSLYRLVTITQLKNTTCVYDYYARLALGSHLFPGSALHANFALPTGSGGITSSGIGASDVSIPVKEIAPQELRKDMAATADSDHQWNITKTANPAEVSFGDVCAADATLTRPVTIRVEWVRLPATPGSVHVVTNIYAKNPAARTITVNVSDTIYQGTTQTTALASTGPVSTDVPANTELLVLTHSATLPNTAGAVGDFLNDVATATYTDKVTGVAVPGMTTATAQATIQSGTESNATANIADQESITGVGLNFSVANPSPSLGSFTGYTAGTPTTGPVIWGLTGETTSRFVTFTKTIYLDQKRITTGVLTDVASLVAAPGRFEATSGPLTVKISSSASVKFTLSKSIPQILGSGERIEVTFHIVGATSGFSSDRTLTFNGGGSTTQSVDLTGLMPDTYSVTETSSQFFASPSSVGVPSQLQPVGGNQQTVNLSADANGVVSNCSGTAAFENVIPLILFPTAQVKKITFPALLAGDPDFTWTFTLNGPSDFCGMGCNSVTQTAGAGAPYVDFGVSLQKEGAYTVTETTKGPTWVLTSAAPDSQPDKVCDFTVNFPQDIGATLSCTFTNTKQGKAKVVKTVSGAALSGTQAFTFQLRKDATIIADGTTLESLTANVGNDGTLNFTTLLVPGNTYQICEVVMPGWMTTLGTFVPSSFTPPNGVAPNPGVDNSILCRDFTVAAGETKTFAVDNSPPPGGRALTIGFWKNWASCKASGGKQAPTLDRTMAQAEPTGIKVDSFYLHGSTATPDKAPDCAKAVSLLSKNNYAGVNKASDPLFNMAAQLVAAELNLAAGAYSCGPVATAIISANALLTKYSFNGTSYGNVTYPKLLALDATLANSLAKRLDDYNNNRTVACQ